MIQLHRWHRFESCVCTIYCSSISIAAGEPAKDDAIHACTRACTFASSFTLEAKPSVVYLFTRADEFAVDDGGVTGAGVGGIVSDDDSAPMRSAIQRMMCCGAGLPPRTELVELNNDRENIADADADADVDADAEADATDEAYVCNEE